MRPRVEDTLCLGCWIHGLEDPDPTPHGQHGDDSATFCIPCFAIVLVATVLQKILPKLLANKLVHNLPLLGFSGDLIVEVALQKLSK